MQQTPNIFYQLLENSYTFSDIYKTNLTQSHFNGIVWIFFLHLSIVEISKSVSKMIKIFKYFRLFDGKKKILLIALQILHEFKNKIKHIQIAICIFKPYFKVKISFLVHHIYYTGMLLIEVIYLQSIFVFVDQIDCPILTMCCFILCYVTIRMSRKWLKQQRSQYIYNVYELNIYHQTTNEIIVMQIIKITFIFMFLCINKQIVHICYSFFNLIKFYR